MLIVHVADVIHANVICALSDDMTRARRETILRQESELKGHQNF